MSNKRKKNHRENYVDLNDIDFAPEVINIIEKPKKENTRTHCICCGKYVGIGGPMVCSQVCEHEMDNLNK